MESKRSLPAQPPLTMESISGLADRLTNDLKALLTFETGELPRTSELSRNWKLDRTLCSRVRAALQSEHALTALQRLPAPGSLHKLIAAAKTRGIDETVIEHTHGHVTELESVIEALGGKKSSLDIIASSNDLELRKKLELSARHSVFEGMSQLLGEQTEAQSTSYFLFPTRDDLSMCSTLAIYGPTNRQRLRMDHDHVVTRFLAQSGALDSADQESQSGPFREGSATVLREFSSSNASNIEISIEDQTVSYLLKGSETADLTPLSLYFASLGREFQNPLLNGDTSIFQCYVSSPVRHFVFDTYIHRSLAEDLNTTFTVTRADPTNDRTNASDKGAKKLETSEQMRKLGSSPAVIRCEPVPVYRDMILSVHERMGWESGDFQLVRLAVKYPLFGYCYTARFINSKFGEPENPHCTT